MTNFSNIIEKLDEMIYKPNNLLITKRKERKAKFRICRMGIPAK